MPSGTLDSVLNWAIPVAVLLIFAGLMYSKMKKPIDYVVQWIKGLFGWAGESIAEAGEGGYTTIYKYGN